MSKEIIYLFANGFPYGNAEPYLETEIQYMTEFDQIHIFSLQLRKRKKGPCRDTPQNTIVHPIFFNPIGYLLCVPLSLLNKDIWKEIKKNLREKGKTIQKNFQLIVYVCRSYYEARKIYKIVKKYENHNVVFYSYRFGYQPYVALLLKKRMKNNGLFITRAHGYDLYENRKNTNYIPMRETVFEYIDHCFPCSENGTCYLRNKYARYSQKIDTRYLGTKDYGTTEKRNEESFSIVSCSNVNSLKRIDLIILALSHIQDIKIRWTHYGTGPLLDELKKLAEAKLKSNIEVVWKGAVSNSALLSEYKEKAYDLFINTSATEGLPVSIMEAMSFGIPCVATDVGGTKEIVSNKKNGLLIDKNANEYTIRDSILCFVHMNTEKYSEYSRSARKTWEDKFNCEMNYRQFAREIHDLCLIKKSEDKAN